jgi:hypothetical protein
LDTHEGHSGSVHRSIVKNSTGIIGGDVDLNVLGAVTERVDGNHVRELITGSTHQKNDLGNWLLECPVGIAGTTALIVSLNATGGLSLAVGGSCILMTPTSISISSPMVLINSGPAQALPVPAIPPIEPKFTEEAKTAAGPDTADDGTKFDKM